jgi:putative inorganic carbon (HCO3(-)) transporter
MSRAYEVTTGGGDNLRAGAISMSQTPKRHSLAYAGLYLFTLVLYIRPNDLLPIGQFPVAKIIAIGALVAFLLEELASGQPFSTRPKELKYLLAIVALMFVSVPLAVSPADAIDTIFDVILKVALVFVLLIHAVTTPERLRRIISLTVLCGTGIAIATLNNFFSGEDLIGGYRATGVVGGMFNNPNDLALALNLLIPLAIGLLLTSTTLLTRLIYLASAVVLGAGIYASYSRGGFVTLVATAVYMLFGMQKRFKRLAAFLLLAFLAVTVLGASLYGARILSIFDSSLDYSVAQGSGAARTETLERALNIMIPNPKVWVVGIGVGNFHILSAHEKVSHNSYLDIAVEVGLPAFVLYLLFLHGVYRGLDDVMRPESRSSDATPLSTTAMAIRASLVSYMVGSFFASVVYLWYLYYIAGFAICLRQIAEDELAPIQEKS